MGFGLLAQMPVAFRFLRSSPGHFASARAGSALRVAIRNVTLLVALTVSQRAAESPLQQLEFPNGEILRGTLLSTENDRWRFLSESLGEISVPIAKAKLKPSPSTTSASVTTAPSSAPDPSSATSTPPPLVLQPTAPAKVEKTSTSPWRRKLEAGYALQSSATLRNDIYFRAELERVKNDYTYRLFGKYLYGRQDGVRYVDRVETGMLVRHTFSDRLIVRHDLTYQNDRLRLLDADALAITGLGYRLVRRPEFTFTAGPGLGVRYREVDFARSGFALSGDFSTETAWKPTERFRFTHTASILAEVGRAAEFRLLSQAVATSMLTRDLSFNVRYEYEFDRGRPVRGGRIDQRVFSTLGYNF